MIKNCLICGKIFYTKPSIVKRGEGKFCSRKCLASYNKIRYKGAGNPFYKKTHSLETRQKISEFHKRFNPNRGKRFPHLWRKSHFWKGGKRYSSGYVYIYSPEHPFRTKQNYVLEHRLVMEKFLGRYLQPYEIVHHKNGNRQDNRIENLLLVIKNENWHPQICPKCGFEFLIK